MSAESGYGHIITSGLTFSYDLGEKNNSFKGAPTTNYNINGSSPIDPWHQVIPNVDATNTPDAGPIKGAKTWKMIKDGSQNQWNGWESPYGGIWTGNAGDIWTTSYWYKTTSPAGITGFGIGGFCASDWSRCYSVTTLANVSSIIPDGEWHYNYTVTQFNESYSNAIIADGPSWGYSTQPGVLFINGLQWEKKSYPTAFAEGTRTATQGLLDITGNYTMDISNVSYDYSGNMYFDGTNDYIEIQSTSMISGTNDFTIESVYTKSGNTGCEIFGNYGNNSGTGVWFSGQYGIYIQGGVYVPGYPVSNGNHHMVATRSSGLVKLYLDGVLVNSGTLNSSIPTGSVNYRIGADTGAAYEPFYGNIHVVKLYNRALSADEVTKNYNHYKKRYSLS